MIWKLTFSADVIYSHFGGCLGTTTNLHPLARWEDHTSVRGNWICWQSTCYCYHQCCYSCCNPCGWCPCCCYCCYCCHCQWVVWHTVCDLWFEWTQQKFLCCSLVNSFRCLVRVFMCLMYLIFSMKSKHSLKLSWTKCSNTASLFLHVSLLILNMVNVLFMPLTLSYISCFSALLIFFLAIGGPNGVL